MTGQETVTKFINMVDDELDTDYMYQLLNDAINEVESLRAWEILKADTTITSASTVLPSDFMFDVLLTDGTSRYRKIKKEEQNILSYGSYSYYLDLANNTIEVVNYNSQTLYLYYSSFSSDVTSTTSWVFPARFHSLIPYKMAEMYYASDAGEKSRSWDDRWRAYFEQKLNTLFTWDDRLKVTNRMPRQYGQSPLQVPVN